MDTKAIRITIILSQSDSKDSPIKDSGKENVLRDLNIVSADTKWVDDMVEDYKHDCLNFRDFVVEVPTQSADFLSNLFDIHRELKDLSLEEQGAMKAIYHLIKILIAKNAKDTSAVLQGIGLLCQVAAVIK